MKPIKHTPRFKRAYDARIAKNAYLREAFFDAVETFVADREIVGDHPLEGRMSRFRAFRIDQDYRVIYVDAEDAYYFVDVGRHRDVYYR